MSHPARILALAGIAAALAGTSCGPRVKPPPLGQEQVPPGEAEDIRQIVRLVRRI